MTSVQAKEMTSVDLNEEGLIFPKYGAMKMRRLTFLPLEDPPTHFHGHFGRLFYTTKITIGHLVFRIDRMSTKSAYRYKILDTYAYR